MFGFHFILPVTIGKRFSLLQTIEDIHLGLVRMYVMHYRTCMFWIIFTSDLVISYTDQIVGIPMGINCAPLVADLFLFCYERDFMTSLSNDNPISLRHLTRPLDIKRIFLILTILILEEWSTKFIHLS